jgi:hypothetical protein
MTELFESPVRGAAVAIPHLFRHPAKREFLSCMIPMDTLPIVNPAERLNTCDALDNKDLLFGRGSDLLLLETQIVAGYRTIFLRGPHGIGKTKLKLSALGWWTNTGLAVCHHFRTEAYITQLELLKVQAEDVLRSWQESTLNQEGRKLCIFVFENLQNLSQTTEAALSSDLRRFKRLLRKLRTIDRVSTILVSACELPWAEDLADALHILGPLSPKAQLDYGMYSLTKIQQQSRVTSNDSEHAGFFERFLELSQGNPLGQEILMRSFCSQTGSPKDFHLRLLSGQGIDVDADSHKDEGAKYITFIQDQLQEICHF